MVDFQLSVEKMLDRLQAGLVAEITRRELHDPLMIGIHTGGGWIAEKLHARLGLKEPLGLLNISFYRDEPLQYGMAMNTFSMGENGLLLEQMVLIT
jgi:pyrimidine operon attenuation protein/uracil phosphoribosyltransferase